MAVEVVKVVVDQKIVNDLEVMVAVEAEMEVEVAEEDDHQQYPFVECHNYQQVFYYADLKNCWDPERSEKEACRKRLDVDNLYRGDILDRRCLIGMINDF
jgi:hypothetical protein